MGGFEWIEGEEKKFLWSWSIETIGAPEVELLEAIRKDAGENVTVFSRPNRGI